MRSQYVGAFAFVLIAIPFDVNATVAYLDFHGTTSEIRAGTNALPAAIANATEWDVQGAIEFTYDDVDIDAYAITGGTLSVNGVSLGAFDGSHYSVDYSDDEEQDPYDANFSISFNSGEFGHSYFALFSEDYSPGQGTRDVWSYLSGFPVGGYQVNEVGIGAWAADIESSNLEFTSRPPGGQPTPPVPEPSPAPLAALGVACMFWLRRQRARS